MIIYLIQNKKIKMSLLFYTLILSVEKDEKPLYPKPKLFDIFLYPTLIVISKSIQLIRGTKKIYYFSNYNHF